MEAKDTVMSENQLIEVIYMAIETPDKDNNEGWKNRQRFNAVAEISFKAGREVEREEIIKTLEHDQQHTTETRGVIMGVVIKYIRSRNKTNSSIGGEEYNHA